MWNDTGAQFPSAEILSPQSGIIQLFIQYHANYFMSFSWVKTNHISSIRTETDIFV